MFAKNKSEKTKELKFLSKKQFRENMTGWLFVLPLVIYFIVFQLAPMVIAFVISLNEWNMRTPMKFVGVENYTHLLSNYQGLFDDFWPSLVVTLKYIVLTVPASVVLVLVVAALLNAKVRGEGIFKTIFYIPSVTSGVAIAAIWMFMLDPQHGMINQLLGTHISFLATKSTALYTLAVMAIWGGLGYNTLIMLSAMKGINESLYEAAEIDGAGPIKKFIHVTVPSVTPIIFFISITSVIGSFQAFDQMYLTTGGGPEKSTMTYMLGLYNQAFEYNNMGIACAMSYILFIIIMIITFIQFKVQPQNVDNGEGGKKRRGNKSRKK
ncbi:MAG: sugar ABC transporter permease [Eubacterium sp.]|nr:sugar ABC transporter permease [Eubacterium sp.]